MDENLDKSHWLNIDEAALALKTTRVYLLMMIKRGLVSAEEHDGEWYVDPAAIAGKCEPGKMFQSSHCKDRQCGGCL